MTEKTPTVTCSHCGGSGEEALSAENARILQELAKSPASAIDLEPVVGSSRKSINNRLEWLRLSGLATRTKVGREWVYSAVKAPAPKRASAA